MRNTAVWLLSCAATLVPSLGSAQSEVLDNAATVPPVVQGARLLGLDLTSNTAYGTQLGARWIGAPHFSASTAAGASMMVWGAGGFFTASTSPTVYLAQLDLEPGVLVPGIACLCKDNHPTNDILITLVQSDITVDPDTAADTPLAAGASSGTPDIAWVLLDPTDFTFTTVEGATAHVFTLGASVSLGTSLAGCWVYFWRQVAPGPAAATFTDVPTTSPFFKYVEALYASGVVGGCTATTYCPSNPVTRGQLAVFLAATLGMGYPW